MSSKIFINQITSKEEVETSLMVKYLQLMEARDGKKYLNIILTDSTGDLEARIWNNAEEMLGEIAKNDFVQVRGKMNFFQGKKQFIIQHLAKLNQEQVQIDDYIMKAARPPEEMYAELLKIVDGLSDVYIKELLQTILKDAEISRRLKLWQAGKTIHHAYKSGLLEHILSCTNLALVLSPHYHVNPNYVVAGCILHDLCKVYELTDGLNVDYTEEGKLIGHLVKGLEIVDRFSYRIKNFPHQVKMHLKHILLSHHGEYSYGSPKIPHTSEAFLVHLIDHMDSKMNALEMVKKTDNSTGHWSGFVKHLDRIVYKADLPFYDRYEDQIEETHDYHQDKKIPSPAPVVTPKKKPAEIKQNLGKMLEGFKVEDKN